jgi:hypothetical protein
VNSEVLPMRGDRRCKCRVGVFVSGCLIAVLATVLAATVCIPGPLPEAGAKTYVGSAACQPCHAQEFSNYAKYSRKSHSYRSVQRMQKGLSTEELKECYACHTTGYGKPGGFVSIERTPGLRDAGCEVCHGPGKEHAETQDPRLIQRKVTLETCQSCHIEERIQTFRYRPLLHGGAH